MYQSIFANFFFLLELFIEVDEMNFVLSCNALSLGIEFSVCRGHLVVLDIVFVIQNDFHFPFFAFLRRLYITR